MPSKHANAGQLIQCGLYDDLRSFAELEQRITALGDENTTVVGDAFEIFVEAYLATTQKMQADTVWLVKQVPLEIRRKMNLPKDAKGIDGIFRTRTKTLVPYQAKYRSQRKPLSFTEVASFLELTERATDRIVFTNSNELADDVKNRDAMRTVRGIDFDGLTERDFKAINCWLREQPIAPQRLSPDLYQKEALSKICETLVKSDRAHVVMACGTGKTLIALWAAEALKPKMVLVLVPSLMLMTQTIDEWSRHNSWESNFIFLCVCSDPKVTATDKNDPVRLNATDLDFHVDTSPKEVRQFLKANPAKVKVIFCTYQSSKVVSDGMRGLKSFDVAIFDEAHKTTGPRGGPFAHSLFDKNIKIRKRLFFTATPRHYDIQHKDREGDFTVASMDDEAIYGPRAYTLTFGSAARQGIICNYKVVISVVDGQEINGFVLQHGDTLVEGDQISARWVANQIAVERAIKKTEARHAITFHSRVSSAKEFSADGTRGIRQYLPKFIVLHVNGSQNSSDRKELIKSFRDAARALITNARCLTEGIDVPAVNMVAFIDPRHSQIDIAQATGRAMRKPRGSDKKVGYVVVPLFLERQRRETLGEALKKTDFSDVSSVLNAMQEQDDDLVQIIRELQEASGRGEIFNPRKLADKVEVLGPSIELSTLRSNIFAEIVDEIGVSWDEWYGRLQLYKKREGHCRVPDAYKSPDGFKLGTWVQNQRRNKAYLSADRKGRLDALEFEWDPDEADWNEGFKNLQAFEKENGHCRVPHAIKYPDDYRLGYWVQEQRRKKTKNKLSADKRRQLNTIGFVWDPDEADWNEGFKNLQAFEKENGHCRVPHAIKYPDDYRLGYWVQEQRRKKTKNKLSADKRRQLNTIGFVWDPDEADWNEGFKNLQAFEKENGHCRVPHAIKYPDDYRLGYWVQEQRRKKTKDKLSADKRRRLNTIGFVWDARAATKSKTQKSARKKQKRR